MLKSISSYKYFNLPSNKKSNIIKLFMFSLLLIIIGCIMVYSASYYSANISYNDEYFYLKKQILGALIGVVSMILFSFIDYKIYKKFKWLFAIVGILVLSFCFVPGLGVSNYGAQRWVNIGITFQPSEIAKFCFIIFAAIQLSQKGSSANKFLNYLPVIIIGLIYAVLIMLEPNMSITLCVIFVMVLMLFLSGIPIKHFCVMAIPAFAVVPALIISEPYRLKRLMAFIDPWASPKKEGFQLIQSLYSLGGGGLMGVGLFNSKQKYLFLPFSESDFIFSIIGEEFGFIGCTLVLILFFYLIKTIFVVAKNASDRFGFLLCAGIGFIIAVQTLINVAVVTGSIPPTGVPLPFISAGSSSLVVFLSAIGIVINVCKNNNKNFINYNK